MSDTPDYDYEAPDYDEEPNVVIVSYRYPDDPPMQPYVKVISRVDVLTAAQARALARTLINMADQLDNGRHVMTTWGELSLTPPRGTTRHWRWPT
jgi:hypothetical protein